MASQEEKAERKELEVSDFTFLLLEGYFHRCVVCGCVFPVPHNREVCRWGTFFLWQPQSVVSGVSEVTRRLVVDSRHDMFIVVQRRPVSVCVTRSFLSVSVFMIAPIDCVCVQGKLKARRSIQRIQREHIT